MTRQIFMVFLIIAASVLLFLRDLRLVSATYDEDFSYVRNSIYLVKNFRWDQEYITLHPPLMYYLHGWPFLFLKPLDSQKTLYISRLAILPIFILFALFLYFLIKRLYGEISGYLGLILYAFNPEILAHARLVTADYLQAITIFIALISFFFFLKLPNLARALSAGIFLGFALISKYSALLLIPLYFLFLLIFLRNYKMFTNAFIKLCLIVLVGVSFIHIPYLFKESGKISELYKNNTIDSLYKNSYTKPLLYLFPRAYLAGVDLQVTTSQGVWWGYFAGKPYYTGLWYFYPIVFLIKTPLPLIIFILLAIFIPSEKTLAFRPGMKRLLSEQKRTTAFRPWGPIYLKNKFINNLDFFLVIATVFFFVYFSFFNKLLIGLRYLLMVYPLLFLFVSKLASVKLFKRTTIYSFSITILILWYVLETIKISPHYLAFTNELVGGPKNAYKYFADSNLDWNQNTIFFDTYLKAHPEITAINPRKPTVGIIAVNVNEMNLYYYYDYQWLRRLNKDPIDNVGYSWLIFEIRLEEIN